MAGTWLYHLVSSFVFVVKQALHPLIVLWLVQLCIFNKKFLREKDKRIPLGLKRLSSYLSQKRAAWALVWTSERSIQFVQQVVLRQCSDQPDQWLRVYQQSWLALEMGQARKISLHKYRFLKKKDKPQHKFRQWIMHYKTRGFHSEGDDIQVQSYSCKREAITNVNSFSRHLVGRWWF